MKKYTATRIQPIQIDDEPESNHAILEPQPSSSFPASSIIKNTLTFHEDNDQGSNSSQSDESFSSSHKNLFFSGKINVQEKFYRNMENISKSRVTNTPPFIQDGVSIEENQSEEYSSEKAALQELLQDNNPENSQKNTLGKQYSEQFKRKFVKNIFDRTKDMNRKSLCSYISKEAHRIRVYPNEVAIWMGIYRIAFRVQQESNFKRISQQKAVHLVEESLVQYLNRNPTEKKYRFIRVANGSFRALQIRKSTGDKWLKRWIHNFKNKLNPKINFERLVKGTKEGYGLSYGNKSFNQFGHITQLFNLGDQNQKQLKYKCEIVRKIDEKIKFQIDKAFQDVQKSTGVDLDKLKGWHYKYGKLKFDYVHGSNLPDQNYRYSRDLDQIQKPIMEFMRKSPGCKFQQILFQVNQILNNTKIASFKKQENVFDWLDKFLDERFKLVDSGYYLK